MFWVFTKFSDDSEKICRCHHVKVPWSPIVQSRSRSGPSGHFPQQPALLASSRSGRAGRGARGALGEPGGEMVGSARDADPPPTCQASPASRAPEPPPRGMCGMPAACCQCSYGRGRSSSALGGCGPRTYTLTQTTGGTLLIFLIGKKLSSRFARQCVKLVTH